MPRSAAPGPPPAGAPQRTAPPPGAGLPGAGYPGAPWPGTLLPRGFFARPAQQVAPDLLGCVLCHETADGMVAVLVTETEAYAGTADPASHAFRGRTARNAVMFGEPGHAYVYFTYGIHFCVNLVCLPAGTASAVLLRAGRVIEGASLAAARRSAARKPAGRLTGAPAAAVSPRDLARGPARLCQALGIDRSLDGADVCAPGSQLRITGRPGGLPAVGSGPRVGVSQAAAIPWRFWIAGEPTVSPYRAHAPRRRTDGRRAAEVGSVPAGADGTMQR
jgi:DNA-3-methyladenine glycosylase